MDGEEEQDAEHDGGKAGTHAAPLLLAELVGQRLGDGKGQHSVQHAQHAGDSLDLDVAEEVLVQIGVQPLTTDAPIMPVRLKNITPSRALL